MVVQHLANYQFHWVTDKVTYATCLQKLPRSARTIILVDDNQQFPVAHKLINLGITVFPHPPLAYDQYIFTYALSCFQQGTYQVLVTAPATPSHGRCSPSSVCKFPHLAKVCNTHSQLSSGQATGLAHTDMDSPVAVNPTNTSPGIHKTLGDSGRPIATLLVLGKASCLFQTSISSPLQLSPGKVPGLADGINSLAACCPPVAGVGDSMLIPDPNLYSVGIPQSNWDEVEEQLLDVQYEISCITKALNRLCQRNLEILPE